MKLFVIKIQPVCLHLYKADFSGVSIPASCAEMDFFFFFVARGLPMSRPVAPFFTRGGSRGGGGGGGGWVATPLFVQNTFFFSHSEEFYFAHSKF